MRYAWAFGAMALGCALMAALLPWWLAVPCAWFAVSFALASAAYARVGPGFLGKRADGEIPLWSLFLNGPFLVLGLASMRMFHVHVPDAPWSEVAPGLILGRRPSRLDTERFRALGVTAILDLCAELPATRARTGREDYLSLPVLDYASPTPAQLDEAIRWIDAHRDGKVYVHCALGRSRSATVVAAWRIASGDGGSVDALERLIRTSHPPVNLMPSQRLVLEDWRRRRIGSTS